MTVMNIVKPAALVLMFAVPATAQSRVPGPINNQARSSVTSTDIQRLQDQVYDASNEVSRLRSRDQATADRLQTQLDEARDEVIYLRVKLRKEGSGQPRRLQRGAGQRGRGALGSAHGLRAPGQFDVAHGRHGLRFAVRATAPERVRRAAAAVTAARPISTRTGPTRLSRRNEVPAGQEIDVRLEKELSSNTAQVEDRFTATAMVDLYQGNDVLIPAGSVLRGVVSSVTNATRTQRKGSLTVAFDQISVNGRSYPIHGTVTQALESEGIKGEATKIGAGAGVGAIIGGILGGAKGALLGVLIGGGGTIAATEGKDVVLPAGSVLRVKFDQPLWFDRWEIDLADFRISTISVRAALAAFTVFSTSFSECAPDKNHASNCDGGGYTPRASIPLKNFPYAAVSAFIADCRSRTGSLVKNGVTSEPKAFTCIGTRGARGVGEAGGQHGAELRHVAIQLRRQLGQRPEPGGHRERIARERAGLVDRTGRRDQLHDIGAAAIGADRQAAADDLAEAGQVRPDAEHLLRAARRRAKPGDHFVEDEQDAVAIADRAQALQEAVAGRDDPHVAGDRLDDDRGDLVAVPLDGRLDRRQVVVAREQRVGRDRRRDAGAGRHAERHRARARLHEERVRVAVIAALELDDLVALRGRARDPDRAHRGFRARADEAHALHGRHQRRDPLREPRLELRGRAEARAARRGGGQRLQQPLRRVAVDERSPRHHVVDVGVAVRVFDARSARARDEERRAADRP